MIFEDLQKVNSYYNQKITYITDSEQYNEGEKWTDARNTGQGDCEDYSLTKLHTLLELGWPIEKLRLASCWVDEKAPGNGHAVLIAEYDNRLWVLDNRYEEVREVIDCTDYVWNSTQAIGGSQEWRSCKSVFSKFYDASFRSE